MTSWSAVSISGVISSLPLCMVVMRMSVMMMMRMWTWWVVHVGLLLLLVVRRTVGIPPPIIFVAHVPRVGRGCRGWVQKSPISSLTHIGKGVQLKRTSVWRNRSWWTHTGTKMRCRQLQNWKVSQSLCEEVMVTSLETCLTSLTTKLKAPLLHRYYRREQQIWLL